MRDRRAYDPAIKVIAVIVSGMVLICLQFNFSDFPTSFQSIFSEVPVITECITYKNDTLIDTICSISVFSHR